MANVLSNTKTYTDIDHVDLLVLSSPLLLLYMLQIISMAAMAADYIILVKSYPMYVCLLIQFKIKQYLQLLIKSDETTGLSNPESTY